MVDGVGASTSPGIAYFVATLLHRYPINPSPRHDVSAYLCSFRNLSPRPPIPSTPHAITDHGHGKCMQTSHLLCLLLCVATGSEGGEGKDKKKGTK